MADVSHKNTYALLGNDSEQDSDREPEPPVKVVDKQAARRGKRDGPDAAPGEFGGTDIRGGNGGRGRGRGGPGGNEGAFRDREAGSNQNRGKPTDEAQGSRGGRGSGGRGERAGRQGRGGRGVRDDRHNRGVPNDHPKQADQSWGANTGSSEWQDEQAGDEMAKAEVSAEGDNGWGADAPSTGGNNGWGVDGDGSAPVNGYAPTSVDPARALEPEGIAEDNSKSYDEYLAEQAEKRLKLGVPELKARKPNEGAKAPKEWENAKTISSKTDNAGAAGDFMAGLGKGEKARRERARKEKQTLDVDFRYVEPDSTRSDHRSGRGGGDRGGRGGYRGGNDGYRGGRGDRGDRRGRGGDRGGRGRGGRGGWGDNHHVNVEGGQVNVEDQSAFPSLGGS